MPLLTSRDPLASCPNRVLVAGTSGSGKSTLAARIAEVIAAPHIEIDALFHGPDWTRRPSFEEDVEAFSSRPTWVIEWQYRQARPLLAHRADLMVWLDLSRPSVMRQVAVRTLKRRVRREVLWNGNIEPPLRTIITDPDHILRWAWKTHAQTADRIRDVLGLRPGLPVIRIGSHREAREWLAGSLRAAASTP